MEKFLKVVKRYKVFLAILLVNIILTLAQPTIGQKSFQIIRNNLLEMLGIIPPIFVLLGLLDVWVKRETMVKFMGEDSGLTGVIIAFVLGSVASGPLYAAFPIAAIFLKKGSKLSNVLIFIGAWSTTKIPLLLFEASSMGVKFTVIRLLMNIVGIILIAAFTQKLLSEEDKEQMYQFAESIDK